MPKALTFLQRALVLLLLAGALWHLALRGRLITDPRLDLGGGEMNVVYGTQKVLLGKALYSDPEQGLFEVVQYTPLYHLTLAAMAKACGIDALDSMSMNAAGRSFCLFLNLISIALVFLLCRRLGLGAWLAMAAAALALAFFTRHCYGRPDALATALLLGMLLVLVQGNGVPLDQRRAAWSALLAVGAVLAKQNAAVAAVIAVLHLAASGDRASLRRFLSFLLLFGSLAALGLLLLGTPSDLYKNLVLSLRNGLGFTLYRDLADQGVYKYYIGWHVLSLAAIIALLRRGTPNERLIAIAAAGSFAAGFAGGLKHGSSMNYLVDAHILGLVAVLAWLQRLRPSVHRIALAGVLAYGALFMQYRLQLLLRIVANDEYRAINARELAADEAIQAWLLERKALDPERPVFINYRGHLELLLNGYAVLPQKDIIEWSLKPPFDLHRLRDMITSGKVQLVISDLPMERLYFMGWDTALEPVAEVEGRWLYRPLPN